MDIYGEEPPATKEGLLSLAIKLINDEENKNLLDEIVGFDVKYSEMYTSEEINYPNFGLMVSYLSNFAIQQRLTKDNVTFVLKCFLFTLKNPKYWEPIMDFVSPKSYAQFNALVDEITKQKRKISEVPENVKLWYECMTSKDLPIIPYDLILDRCTFSEKTSFDIMNAEFIDSYRTTSTSFCEGTCYGKPKNQNDVNGKVYMLIETQNIPGLMLLLGPKTQITCEVVLPPGLRYTWIKKDLSMYVPRLDLVSSFKLEYTHVVEKDQIVPLYKRDQYFRAYLATFIPKVKEDEFLNPKIAERVIYLKNLSQKLDQVFLKHRAQKRIQDVANKFREKTKMKSQQREALKAEQKLEHAMKEALQEEKMLTHNASIEDRKKTNQKFVKADVLYHVALQGKNIPNLSNIKDVLGKFQLSKRAQKYAVGLSNHPNNCTLIRQSANSKNWRYFDSSFDSKIKQSLIQQAQKQKPEKCQ